MGIRILWSPIASARSAFLFLAIADILSALWDALDSVDVPANAPLRSTALAVEFLGIAMSYEASPAHNTSPEAEPLLSDHPHHSEREKPIRSAETTASLWARLSFSWFNPVLLVGFKKPLAMDDLYDLLDSDKSAVCHARLVKLREGSVVLLHLPTGFHLMPV